MLKKEGVVVRQCHMSARLMNPDIYLVQKFMVLTARWVFSTVQWVSLAGWQQTNAEIYHQPVEAYHTHAEVGKFMLN